MPHLTHYYGLYRGWLEKHGLLRSRPFLDWAVGEIERDWGRKDVFVVEAPTGYGKTGLSAAVALYSCREELKSIVAYPTRSLLEDQYGKIGGFVGPALVGKRYMHHAGSRYLVKPVTLTTVDTLSLTLFGIPPEDFETVARYVSGTSLGSIGHYLFSYASVALSNIVLDEVHLLFDSAKSLNFLFLLVEHALSLGQKLVLMSATLPPAFVRVLEGYSPIFSNGRLGDRMRVIRFSDYPDQGFLGDRRSKSYEVVVEGLREGEKHERLLKVLEEGLSQGYDRVVAVFDTVEDASTFYEKVKALGGDRIKSRMLLHSRFSERDRRRKHEELQRAKAEGGYIIVATQTIEVGVDVSSNFFITEAAPASSLIQRLGRFLRYEGEKHGRVYVWYEVDGQGSIKNTQSKYKVYDYGLTRRTIEWLEGRAEEASGSTRRFSSRSFSFHDPQSYVELLGYVYQEEDFQVDREKIRRFFADIFGEIERMSVEALAKLIELEGSFVRDSALVPVIPKSVVDGKDPAAIRLEEIEEHALPVTVDYLGKAKVSCVIVKRKSGEEGGEHLEMEGPEAYLGLLAGGRLSDFVKQVLFKRVVAFVVDQPYSHETGLMPNG